MQRLKRIAHAIQLLVIVHVTPDSLKSNIAIQLSNRYDTTSSGVNRFITD